MKLMLLYLITVIIFAPGPVRGQSHNKRGSAERGWADRTTLARTFKTMATVTVEVVADRSPMISTVQGCDSGNCGSEPSAVPLYGLYANVGTVQNVTGVLISISDHDDTSSNDDEDGTNEYVSSTDSEQNGKNWVGVLLYGDHHRSDENIGSTCSTECQLLLDRMKKVMWLGASAIILLAMNKNVLRELDIGQLISRPVVIIEDLENITYLLSALSTKLRLGAKIAFSSPASDWQTYTVWSACWRAYPGSGVVCASDTTRLSKTNPSQFWSYFYSVLAVIMLLLMIKTKQRPFEDDTDDSESVGQLVKQALLSMKTRRYRRLASICNHDDSERDTCAICLDQFYCRQKIRILPCVHVFHRKCVDPWLIQHPTCPLCKLNIIRDEP